MAPLPATRFAAKPCCIGRHDQFSGASRFRFAILQTRSRFEQAGQPGKTLSEWTSRPAATVASRGFMNTTDKAPARRVREPKPATASAGGVTLPEMDSIIGYKLRRAQLMVFQDFLQSFAKLDLRPAEFSVLAMIARTPGLKQSEIAAALGIKRANFVALMDGLEGRGLADRRKGDIDRRSHSLHLTPDGVRFVRKMMAVWNTHENRMIERLGGTEERDRLIALLDRLLAPDATPVP